MTNDARIIDLAQDVYLARYGQENELDEDSTDSFVSQIVRQVNQLSRELEKKADWNFVRTNNASVGTVSTADTISYPLPSNIRKLAISPHRDLTIQFDGSIVSTFRLVNADQTVDPNHYDVRSRATVQRRNIIFSRSLSEIEVGGSIVADTIEWIPTLSRSDTALLDILDENPDIRQLYVLGVVKNQTLPDVVQGGLTPSFSQKYAEYLADCIAENNASADADDQDRENFGWVSGVGFN
jgi:hypothetical protein